jgi:CRP/FNR family transcriptional regulator, cyclic AMP receptor protein
MRFGSAHDGRIVRYGQSIAPLLEVDADLGRDLPVDRREAARRAVHLRVVQLKRGPWAPGELLSAGAGHLGVLVVDGLLGRELLAGDAASLELLGPGDLIRPWEESADFELLRAAVRWSVLAPTRVALLDRQVAGRLAAYPEIHGALLERATARSCRLAVLQAISHITRVDRRLMTLFWHLAERWGRVTPAGVVVPLALSHRMLGQLVGARRPTVSAAMGALTHAGEVSRGADGTWLLTGSPVGTPEAKVSRFVAPRRPTLQPVSGSVAL